MQTVNEIKYAMDEVGDWWWIADCDGDQVDGIEGSVHAVEIKGGEGQGEYCHVVVKVVNGDSIRHFKKVGCRVSHEGTVWDGPFTEVSPVQKTVTVWE